ncbi:zinc finger protein 420-like [Phyllopteryx taeniolatus]|uniref:zinc finger protein 420-like n=1 Tax=Phyllopteryx taeniolatus TaxID=161469 RepID=UPI002AD3441A|nr:zinc finger protein 420-like [Phyllopteryx taeniolatus]
MWQTLKKQDFTSYWEVADFVSSVSGTVPELLAFKHRLQLDLGLRARVNEEEEASIHFLELIQVLLKDPEERQHFFADVFPTLYGLEYERDLRISIAQEQPNLSAPDEWSHIHETTVDEVTVEVTAEVEVDERDATMAENVSCLSEADGGVEQAEATTTDVDEGKEEGGMDEKQSEVTRTHQADVHQDNSASVKARSSSGPHDCPDCDKKFKFASSLTAHRVIHTGERPHRCSDCGRRFSFRQALERHTKTHKTGRGYNRAICGETFQSSSARTEHKQTHIADGTYTCPQRERKLTRAPALSRHLKTHNVRSAGVESDAAAEVPGNAAPENVAQVAPLVDVRTSRRKRKPTAKIQAIDSQKRTNGKRKPKATGERPTTLKRLPFSCAADGASTASSRPERSLRRAEKRGVHSEDDETALADEQCRFNCQECGKSFKFLSVLESHRRIHTGEQPFLCSQCGRRFSFKQSLERHKQTHKSGRRYERVTRGEFSKCVAAQRSRAENGEFACSECGREFAWKSALTRHLKTHGEDAGEAASSLKCPRCELSFSCASYLTGHLRTHREERGHACGCGKSFTHRAALTAHQRIHQKDRPHVCTQCGKGFLYKGGLATHMKIHSEEMPFMCSFCGKRFKRERNMKKHERCHTRENVYSCSQCDKSFVYKATLIRHELTHSGERPYLCSDCGKGFFSHAELLKHERFHTGHKPFQCPQCEKKFTQSCYLTIHLRYHTGARPYSCVECDKSFLSANRLKRHTRTHTGEKPFRCELCGKGFRQSYHLKTHQRTHNKIT